MATKEDVQRTTMSNTVVFALLDLMEQAMQGTVSGLNPELREFYKRIDTMAYQIGKGIRKPAYVASGVRKESSINMESLGVSAEEQTQVNDSIGKYSNPAELAEDVWDRIEREQKEWEAKQLAAGTAAAANIIPNERRKEIRNEDSTPTDNDNVFAAFSKQHSIDIGDL